MITLLEGFLHPSDEFTPFPFWFLNGDLNSAEIERQLHDFKSKGVMGVVLHPRIGIPNHIKYLSKEFLDIIESAVSTAEELGMRVLLYDEGMYPSGSANGLVVKKNPDFAAKGMRLIFDESQLRAGERVLIRFAAVMPSDTEYSRETVRILSDGEKPAPDEREIIIACGFTRGTIRGIHAGEDDGQPFAPPAGDIMNPEAVSALIEITHEAYYSRLKNAFGKTVIGFFTDEPTPVGRNAPRGALPWTDGFDSELFSSGLDAHDLPALWLSCGGDEVRIRSTYSKCVSDALVRSYYRPIADWCVEHGISLCGHPHSPQDSALLGTFQIPGQDIVWRWVAPENDLALSGAESAQAKCASDRARHMGARRNLNECFGCCGKDGEMWSFNVDDMKWYLDWLFARGCNMILPHAFFYELKEPVQFDRPPDAGPNNIWWKHYAQISNYIKRMSMINTDCVNRARIAVLATGSVCPVDEIRRLYERQIEFNYLTEDDLISLSRMSDGRLCVASQVYDAVMVCKLHYDNRAVRLLSEYEKQGLRMLRPNSNNLDEYKIVRLSRACKDIRATHILRGDEEIVMLFNEGERDYNGRVKLPISGDIALLNAWTGEAHRLLAPDGSISISIPRRGSVVLANCKGADALNPLPRSRKIKFARSLDSLWQMTIPDGSTIKGLRDWREIDKIHLYSGSVKYSCRISLKEKPVGAELTLGDVCEQAEAYINGEYIGAALLKPFMFDLGSRLEKGVNALEVIVTNSLVSKHSGRSAKSGMLGKTKLTVFDKRDS